MTSFVLDKCKKYANNLDNALEKKTGHKWKEMSFDNLVRFLYKPTDPSSLGISRMLFGFTMILDAPEERGGAEMDLRWGDPQGCHFPLIPMQILSLPYMAVLYATMWLGAIGICLGYKFRKSVLLFVVPYWYLFLLEKSFWNNHSYLFGLVGFLLIGTQANNYLSLDAYYDKSKNDKPVPYWNYFILKYQFFILYFVAGLKKSDKEWLSGYAMSNLSAHWVFDPFKFFLTVKQIDYLIVHWFAFVFDLTVCFWMMYEYTRPVAMIFCASFHLMNSRLFRIGMFPWVCLATMPLFCPPDWPKTWKTWINENIAEWKTRICVLKNCNSSDLMIEKNVPHEDDELKKSNKSDQIQDNTENQEINDDLLEEKSTNEIKTDCDKKQNDEKSNIEITWKKKIVVYLLLMYMSLQSFLPYSHFITKGYNNWTNGLYGYSWDMMVHNWDTILVLIKVVDNESQTEMFLDPNAWTPNDRWTKHGDMMHQYARCLQRNLIIDLNHKEKSKTITAKRKFDTKYNLVYEIVNDREKFDDDDELEVQEEIKSKNISIYIDVWCSMNGRFQQRMFNPNYDLLKVDWSPFSKIKWLMPLLTEFSDWRKTMSQIENEVYSWNNYTDVLFVADFPDLYLENYISPDLYNVTLTVLEGQVFYEHPIKKKSKYKSHLPEKSKAVYLMKGETHQIKSGSFHRIHTVGTGPSCYMYTFMNATKRSMEEDPTRINEDLKVANQKPKLPLVAEFLTRIRNMGYFLQHIGNAFLHIFYGVPMMRRVEIR